MLSIVRKMLGEKQANDAAISQHLNECFVEMARFELSRKEPPANTVQVWESLIEVEELTAADVQLNVDRAIKRIEWAKLAADLGKLQKAAETLPQEAQAFGEKIHAQHRANLKKLAELETAAANAQGPYLSAVAAQGDLLASAIRTAEEMEITGRQSELRSERRRLEEKLVLNPNFGDPNAVPSISTHPAALADRAARELNRIKDDPRTPKGNIERAKSWLKAATAEVAKIKLRISEIDEALTVIEEELVPILAAKSLPESFQVLRAKPSRDELLKQNAVRLGWYDQSEHGSHRVGVN